MVKLAEKHGDKVHAISLNLDYEGGDAQLDDKARAKIQRVLDKFEIRVTNYISTTGADTVLEELGAGAGLPCVVIYDAKGAKAKVFDGMFSYDEDVATVVDDLIAAAAD